MMKIVSLSLIIFNFFCLLSSSLASANSSKYFCTGESNQFFIKINQNSKTVLIGNKGPNKYWTESNYIFWQSAKDYSVYEYTFKKSYNKLSGVLKVKSHHLVTSKNDWYDYQCSISN